MTFTVAGVLSMIVYWRVLEMFNMFSDSVVYATCTHHV